MHIKKDLTPRAMRLEVTSDRQKRDHFRARGDARSDPRREECQGIGRYSGHGCAVVARAMADLLQTAGQDVLAGAVVAAKVAASHKMKFALGIGVFFLLGGIMMVSMFGGPVWFTLVDLIGAYLPMGYLGGLLGGAKKPQPA